MYKKRSNRGRPAHYVTWFSLWMEVKGFTLIELARATCYSETTIENWRRGEGISRHAAQLLRARWEDCPVHVLGGPAPLISDKLPVNARTPQLYRCLLKKAGMVPEGATILAVELERARGIRVYAPRKPCPPIVLEPEQDAMPGS